MKRVRFTHTLLALAMSVGAWAQGPNGSGTYYQNANGQKGQALKTALSKIISTGTKDLGYNGLWTAYETTDLRPDGTIWDIYSNITKYDPKKTGQASIRKRATYITANTPRPKAGLARLAP